MIDVPVRVKDALKDGSYKKEYKIQVLGYNDRVLQTISNSNLVSESVSIDERMCSGDELKFGLCEGSNLEFQYFDTESNPIGNITGKRIKVFIDCYFKSEQGWINAWEIPMGYFTVDECSRQASTGIIKASCYNKLKSDYLDAKANSQILTMIDKPIYLILSDLLESYSINEHTESAPLEMVYTDENDYNLNQIQSLASFFPFHLYTDESKTSYKTYYYFNFEIGCYSNVFYQYYKDYLYESLVNQVRAIRSSEFTTLYEMTGYIDKAGPLYSVDYIIQHDSTPDMHISLVPSVYFNPNVDFNLYSGAKSYVSGWKFGSSPDSTDQSNKKVARFSFPICIESTKIKTLSNAKATFHAVFEMLRQTLFVPYIKTGYECRIRTDTTPIEIETLDADVINETPITLRDLQSAVFEVNCQYGALDRNTDLFSGVTLNNSRLYPADALYPSNTLYPSSESESASKAMYSSLWADEGNIRSFKYLIITYKGTDGNDHTLQRTVNSNGTDNYNMSDNWLFRNLTWNSSQIANYADAMAQKLVNVRWFPFQMWCAGLPYLEAGDEIEINTAGGTYISYVLARKLSGIQNLQDTYENGTLNIF